MDSVVQLPNATLANSISERTGVSLPPFFFLFFFPSLLLVSIS